MRNSYEAHPVKAPPERSATLHRFVSQPSGRSGGTAYAPQSLCPSGHVWLKDPEFGILTGNLRGRQRSARLSRLWREQGSSADVHFFFPFSGNVDEFCMWTFGGDTQIWRNEAWEIVEVITGWNFTRAVIEFSPGRWSNHHLGGGTQKQPGEISPG